jgi:hypothetical protein
MKGVMPSRLKANEAVSGRVQIEDLLYVADVELPGDWASGVCAATCRLFRRLLEAIRWLKC